MVRAMLGLGLSDPKKQSAAQQPEALADFCEEGFRMGTNLTLQRILINKPHFARIPSGALVR